MTVPGPIGDDARRHGMGCTVIAPQIMQEKPTRASMEKLTLSRRSALGGVIKEVARQLGEIHGAVVGLEALQRLGGVLLAGDGNEMVEGRAPVRAGVEVPALLLQVIARGKLAPLVEPDDAEVNLLPGVTVPVFAGAGGEEITKSLQILFAAEGSLRLHERSGMEKLG